ncbi:MAG: DUF3794 domain-containing protein [Clostridia bacterium]|nr:DUF3794 domain-containing protein [Clostridia bacterium]
MAYESDFYIARIEKEDSKEINEEFVLPDYQPEVKKILTCREAVSLPSVSVEAGSVTAEGNLRFNVIYVGNDNDLYSAQFECGYSFSVPGLPQDASISDAVSVNAESVSAKAISPRRISVRGRLKALFAVQSKDGDEECITESSLPPSCEALCKSVDYTRVVSLDCEMFELADEVVNDISAEAPRVICCESNAFVSDTDNVNGRVNVRGEVTTDILVCDDTRDELPRIIRRKTPFAYTMSEGLARENDMICAVVTPTASECRIEDGGILIDLCCSVKAYALSLESEMVCTDIYSPRNEITPNESVFDTYIPIACDNKNMSLNFALSASEAGIAKERKIVCSFASAVCEKISVGGENGRESIIGKIVFKLITADDSNECADYECNEIALPFKYDISREMRAISADSSSVLFANASATRTIARYDGERIGLDTELSIAFFILKRQKNMGIASIVLGEKTEKKDECVRIIYPTIGESLWSVAKRMRLPISSIAAKNGIATDTEKDSPQSLSGVKYLVI